jgi:hypothetical protein
MADNQTVDNGALSDFTVSTDEGTGGHVQRVKLAYSADGSETHVEASASGLKVYNAVEDEAHSTGDAGVMALAVRRDTAAASSGTDGDYEPLQTDDTGRLRTAGILLDSNGDQLNFNKPSVKSVTTGSATTYAAGDAIGTALSFANAAAESGGSGHILRCTILDLDDLTHDGTNGQYRLDLFHTTVTVTDDASYTGALDDTEAHYYIGSIDTDDAGASGAGWVDLGSAKAVTITSGLPLAYECAATTLFGVLVCVTADSGATTANGKVIDLQVMPD